MTVMAMINGGRDRVSRVSQNGQSDDRHLDIGQCGNIWLRPLGARPPSIGPCRKVECTQVGLYQIPYCGRRGEMKAAATFFELVHLGLPSIPRFPTASSRLWTLSPVHTTTWGI